MKRFGFILSLFIIAMPVYSQIVEIPDTFFLQALIYNGVDTNGDNLISYTEAESLNYLDITSTDPEKRIKDLTGIKAFINLDTLICSKNQLDTLDLSMNTALKYLDCNYNLLTQINISNCAALEYLSAYNNRLLVIDVSKNIALEYLLVESNYLSSLDVTKNPALLYLGFGGFDHTITDIDISNNTELKYLECNYCQLTELDISKNTKLNDLRCHGNELASLDISNNPALLQLYCSNNKLNYIDLSSNKLLYKLVCESNNLTSIIFPPHSFFYTGNMLYLYLSGNTFNSLDISLIPNVIDLSIADMPELTEVCVWELPFPPEGVTIDTSGSPNIVFTMDCGGTAIKRNTQTEFSFYPNPANELINMVFQSPGQYTVKITSLNGKLLICEDMEGTSHQLNFSSLQKGVYFITVRSEDFVIANKIIKQ